MKYFIDVSPELRLLLISTVVAFIGFILLLIQAIKDGKD